MKGGRKGQRLKREKTEVILPIILGKIGLQQGAVVSVTICM